MEATDPWHFYHSSTESSYDAGDERSTGGMPPTHLSGMRQPKGNVAEQAAVDDELEIEAAVAEGQEVAGALIDMKSITI